MENNFKNTQLLRLLFWETTIKCNLTCAHCRRIETDEAADADLSTSQAKGLIEQLAALAEKQSFGPILVFSGGEPLCRNDLFELVEYANSLAIVPALATNGTLIDSTVADRIKNSAIRRVSISLDGATGSVHNKLRKLEGSFESAIAGIENLAQRAVPFQINVTITKHNYHQLEQIYRLAASLGAVAVHIFMLVPVGCGQDIAQADMLTPQEYESMLLKIAQLDSRSEVQIKVTCAPHYERVIRQHGLHKTRQGHPHLAGAGHDKHNAPRRGCLAGLGVLFVAHQGDVFPCGYLPVKCGNILDTPLEEIWYRNSDLAVMRDSDKLKGKCGICEFRRLCGGCRARAYAATGDYTRDEPYCTYQPDRTEAKKTCNNTE